MILLFNKECLLIGVFKNLKTLPLNGNSIEIDFKDSYLETIINLEKAKFYKGIIYMRVDPIKKYFEDTIHINDYIEFTYKFKNEHKGEIENGIR